MDDYIRREYALAVFGDLHPLDYNANAYYHKIQKLPSADVRPTVRGKWLLTLTHHYPYCSNCDWMPEEDEMTRGFYRFCPACGAEMRSEE